MDVERLRGQKQPDLPGMPQEPKERRPEISIKKREPIISGDDFISQKEMEKIWDKKMTEKKGIKILWTEYISVSGWGESNDEISLTSDGVFKINNQSEIGEKEFEELIRKNFMPDRAEEIFKKIKEVKEKNNLN